MIYPAFIHLFGDPVLPKLRGVGVYWSTSQTRGVGGHANSTQKSLRSAIRLITFCLLCEATMATTKIMAIFYCIIAPIQKHHQGGGDTCCRLCGCIGGNFSHIFRDCQDNKMLVGRDLQTLLFVKNMCLGDILSEKLKTQQY